MKPSELRRKTPLLANVPLQRRTVLPADRFARSKLQGNQAGHRQPSKPKRRTTIPAKVRNALHARSGGVCEMAQPGCTGVATEAAHRLKRGMGGRKGAALAAHDVLSNLLHLDHFCHQRLCHSRPSEAYATGWMLREGQSPTVERVLYRGVWRWLSDDGAVLTSVLHHQAEEAS